MPYLKESQLDNRMCRFCAFARVDMVCAGLTYVYYRCEWASTKHNHNPHRVAVSKNNARFQPTDYRILSCNSFTPKEGG